MSIVLGYISGIGRVRKRWCFPDPLRQEIEKIANATGMSVASVVETLLWSSLGAIPKNRPEPRSAPALEESAEEPLDESPEEPPESLFSHGEDMNQALLLEKAEKTIATALSTFRFGKGSWKHNDEGITRIERFAAAHQVSVEAISQWLDQHADWSWLTARWLEEGSVPSPYATVAVMEGSMRRFHMDAIRSLDTRLTETPDLQEVDLTEEDRAAGSALKPWQHAGVRDAKTKGAAPQPRRRADRAGLRAPGQ